MLYPIYAIKDNLTNFDGISLARNDADAYRGFAHACMYERNTMHTHPQDYTLFRIGEMDVDTGEITPCVPKIIVNAADIIVKEK